MRLLLRILAVLAIPVGIAAFYNVYGDEPTLDANARRTACGGEGARCHLRLARLGRTPFRRAYVFTGGEGHVQVDCRRSMVLVGDYACARVAVDL